MLLLLFSSNVTPRICVATARPPPDAKSLIVPPCVRFYRIIVTHGLMSTQAMAFACEAFRGRVQTKEGQNRAEACMVKKIALEEHFLCPGFEDYWNPTTGDLPAAKRDQARARLCDFGEIRLAAMDRAGIARAILGLAGPGVQAERDAATAIRNARAANDFLAREIQKRPD